MKRALKSNINNIVQIRTCIGCRSTDAKNSLIRLVNSRDGIIVDPTGKQNGRGAYIHTDQQCVDRILDGRMLSKALRVEIGPDELLGLKTDIKVVSAKMSVEVVQ